MLIEITPRLKEYVAEQLSCGDRKLTSGEVSVRIIRVEGKGMIADVELEITAHAYEERIEKQDEICRNIRSYVLKEIPSFEDVQVWLKLSELGHSWED